MAVGFCKDNLPYFPLKYRKGFDLHAYKEPTLFSDLCKIPLFLSPYCFCLSIVNRFALSDFPFPTVNGQFSIFGGNGGEQIRLF